MTPSTGPNLASHYPWPLIAAGLVAFGALFATGGQFAGLIVLAGLLVMSRVLPGRLTDAFLVRWSLRVVAYGLLLAFLGLPQSEVNFWYVKPEWMSRIGALLAFELVLRSYLAKPGHRAVAHAGEGLLIATLVFITACTTYDRGPLAWLAPPFVVACLWTVRTVAAAGRPAAGRTPVRSRLHTARRGVATALALGLGVITVALVSTFDQKFSAFAVRFLQEHIRRGPSGEIGLGDAPQLQDVFNPAASMERVLLVDGATGERHLRVMTYATYADGRWSPRAEDRAFEAVDPRRLRPTRPGRDVRITPFSEEAAAFLAVPADAVGLSADLRLGADSTGVLRPQVGEVAVAWTATLPLTGPPTVGLAPAPTEGQRAELLAFPPEVSGAVRDLAVRVAGEGDDYTRVRRLEAYLRTTHAYSLRFSPEGEPLGDFILNRRAAHCQYFASALVVMSRAVGVPARLVTGYYAHEPSGDGGTVVRQRDAHAWAEFYAGPRGWVLADATPAGGRPDEAFPSVSASRRAWEAVTDAPGRLRAWIESGGLLSAAYLAAVLIPAVGVVRLAVYVVVRLRTHRRLFDAHAASDPALRAAARRLDAIISRLASPDAAPTPPQHTFRSRLAGRELPGDLAAALVLYDQARFGPADPAGMKKLSELLTRLEQRTPHALPEP